MHHYTIIRTRIAALLLPTSLTLAMFCGSLITVARAAEAEEKTHTAAEHAEKLAALRKAFDGPVDIYFDPKQVESSTPAISGARFVDIIDITGKDLLRFEKGTDRWIVDPDAVLVFKVAKK